MVTTAKQQKRKVTHDPPVRKDGKCAVCKGPKPHPDDPKKIYRTELDPFCSTKCCKAYYGVVFDLPTATTRYMSRR